jgi:hypothetical protein
VLPSISASSRSKAVGRTQVIRNSVIAAVVGATCGAAAGLWSIRSWPPHVAAAVQTPRESAVVASSPAKPVSVDQDATVPIPPKPQTTPPPPLRTGDDRNVLQRARQLAQRPDVRALLELREGFVRRAVERGETESAATRGQIDELDRSLAEARTLQLKLDRQALRGSTAAASNLP